MKWISVNEDLPNLDSCVDVCDKYGEVMQAWYVKNEKGYIYWSDYVNNEIFNVKFWTPKRLPPKSILKKLK